MKKYPNTRAGWHKWYVNRFNKTGREVAATLALWFLLNHIEFGEESYSPGKA